MKKSVLQLCNVTAVSVPLFYQDKAMEPHYPVVILTLDCSMVGVLFGSAGEGTAGQKLMIYAHRIVPRIDKLSGFTSNISLITFMT